VASIKIQNKVLTHKLIDRQTDADKAHSRTQRVNSRLHTVAK